MYTISSFLSATFHLAECFCLFMLKQRRQWHPTPVLSPGKSHGWRSLVGCGPWGCWESDMTEQLHFHFSLSCTGEGNGNPLQCSCLENPRDGRAWWAAVYGMKWLSSSSSSSMLKHVSVLCSFSWLNNISSHGYTTFCLSIHQLIDNWICWSTLEIIAQEEWSSVGVTHNNQVEKEP